MINLYVNEATPTNEILAYVGIYDPDARENGTIRSVDLTILDATTPTLKSLKQRQSKLDRMKLAGVSRQDLVRDLETELESLLNSLSTSSTSKPSGINQQELPLKLTKISDKLFTLQLSKRLNFNFFEAYSIEMRIRDNGTRPQLESKTRINLNVLGNNKFAPVFLNPQQAEIDIKDGLVFINFYEWTVLF